MLAAGVQYLYVLWLLADGADTRSPPPAKGTGVDRYSTEIVAEQMQMLGGRVADGEASSAKPAVRKAVPEPAPTNGGAVVADDIPFNLAGAGRAWMCI